MTPFTAPPTCATLRAVTNKALASSRVVSHLPDGTRLELAGWWLEVPETADPDTGIPKLAGKPVLHLFWEPK